MAQAHFLPGRRHAAKLGALLALVLVFAQTAAVMHGYSHFRAAGGSPDAPARSGETCPDCLSFAPVLAAAGGTSLIVAVARAEVETTYRIVVAPLVGHAPLHAFRSRAPPLPA